MTQEEKYMKEAIKQAKKAAVIGDVPIGCVIVEDDKIIARAYNQRNKKKTTLAHAELLAIQKASKKVNDWRLESCDRSDESKGGLCRICIEYFTD